jgi:hypothetical protein
MPAPSIQCAEPTPPSDPNPPNAQVFCGQLVSVSFLVLQAWCAPYKRAGGTSPQRLEASQWRCCCATHELSRRPSSADNYLALVTDTSLVFIFMSSLGLQVNNAALLAPPSPGAQHKVVVDGMLLSATLYCATFFVFPLTLTTWLVAAKRRKVPAPLREPLMLCLDLETDEVRTCNVDEVRACSVGAARPRPVNRTESSQSSSCNSVPIG